MTDLPEPKTIEELQQLVRESAATRVVGGGTKSALSRQATISLNAMSGVLDYNPSEYTFTALAGTRLSDINRMLAEHDQFLPFDPPLASAGATLGGTVAAGLSGSGRFRFGGIRDFFLGVRLVTGGGRVVFGGGKVVKNAAGFDFPKLLVGSLGRLGIMCELTFKVFPSPAAFRTLLFEVRDAQFAQQVLAQVARSQVESYCLDFQPPRQIAVRVGGRAEAIEARASRIEAIARQIDPDLSVSIQADDAEAAYWADVGEFQWLEAGQQLTKMAISPHDVTPLEDFLDTSGAAFTRRYCVGGNLAWLGSSGDQALQQLREISARLRRPALVLTGDCDQPLIDARETSPLLTRLNAVFDPDGKLST